MPEVIFEDDFSKPLDGRYKRDAFRFSGYPQDETLPGNGEFQHYATEMSQITYGVLQLNARPMTGVENMKWIDRCLDPKMKVPPSQLRNLLCVTHVAGMVTTYPNKPFGPGTIFSARFKAPLGKALWGALWAFDEWTQGEVDFFEGNGKPESDPAGNFSQARHDHKAGIHGGVPKRSIDGGWHVIKADWTDPKKIVYYLDDEVTGELAVGPNMLKPMALIANLAVGAQHWPWVGVPDNSPMSSPSLWLDWWKVEKP